MQQTAHGLNAMRSGWDVDLLVRYHLSPSS